MAEGGPTDLSGLGDTAIRVVGERVCGEQFLKGANTYLRTFGFPSSPSPSSSSSPKTAGGEITAAICGVVETVERVVAVRGVPKRYAAEVGDVVVGRIVEVTNGRWVVDLASHQHAVMLLANVTEPGGILRRRGREDELSMRNLFSDGDLISAEVQRVNPDGSASLHTRSAHKYGHVPSQGVLVKVTPGLIRRVKHHFHVFPFGVSAIFGTNGFVWVFRTTIATLKDLAHSAHTSNTSAVLDAATGSSTNKDKPKTEVAEDSLTALSQFLTLPEPAEGESILLDDAVDVRLAVARLRNCLQVMDQEGFAIEPSTVTEAFRATVSAQLRPFDVLSAENVDVVEKGVRTARTGHRHAARKRMRGEHE